jgi:hypothetical protein
MARISHRAWRRASQRTIAGVLAYALVLQSFIFALDIGGAANAAETGTVWAGFELCAHGGTTSVPGIPAQGPDGTIHCVFCVAGAVFLNCAPPGVVQSNKIVLSEAVWPLAASRFVAIPVIESAWPRGPPTAA